MLILKMTLKAIDSPDRSFSSVQPRNVNECYCLICILPCLISRLISFIIFFCGKQYTFGLVFPKMNAEFVFDKPVADIQTVQFR